MYLCNLYNWLSHILHTKEEYRERTGTLALVGPRFADPMLGFGIVRLKNGHASPQHVVTRCTYYERYTTEEALQAAAKSYGGLTGDGTFLNPKSR